MSLTAWVDDPERLYARDEMRRIVREKLSNLPDRYRIAVVLRDIEQLSTAEAAAALGIPVASLKTRLLRGRLMMREALAPLFDAGAKGGGRCLAATSFAPSSRTSSTRRFPSRSAGWSSIT